MENDYCETKMNGGGTSFLGEDKKFGLDMLNLSYLCAILVQKGSRGLKYRFVDKRNVRTELDL